MNFEEWQLDLLNRSDGFTSANHVYWFVVHNMTMNRDSFKQLWDKIRDICETQGVEWAIMLMAHGTYVFTDKPMHIDPVILKLADGINFEGEIKDGQGIVNQINTFVSGITK